MAEHRNTAISIVDQGPAVEVRGIRLPAHCRAWYLEYPPGATPLLRGLMGSASAPPLASYEVSLKLVDGVLIPTEFTILGSAEAPITPTALREVRFQEVVDGIVGTVAALLERQRGRAGSMISDDEHDAIQSRAIGRRRLTTSLLHQVATVVRNNPDQPTKQVSEQLYTSHRNATRWIAEARRRGILDLGEDQ